MGSPFTLLTGGVGPPPDLDAESQRRLVLQAVREVCPDELGGYRKKQPTFEEFSRELTQDFWVTLFLIWLPFVSIPMGLDLLARWRVKKALESGWGKWLARPDPECEVWVLEGDIRRLLKQLPRSHKRQRKEIERELQRVTEHWSENQKKLVALRETYQAMSEARLLQRGAEAAERLRTADDPLTTATVEREMRAIDAQFEARRAIEAWIERLEAAQAEATACLSNLRAQLTLTLAGGAMPELSGVSEVATTLHTLNTNLAATQSATEEVLQLGRSR
jgi:hypothetical protein